jgi:lysine 2,3-aminomutase
MTIRDVDTLVAERLTSTAGAPRLREVAARYAVAITPDVVSLIDRDDPTDPIARQFVPSADELVTLPNERGDPIGDGAHSSVPGLVHRYRDRVLLKIVSVCPVYCRFCFRREMVGPGGDDPLTGATLEAAFDHIARHDEIWEVILTGGDPFMLSARRARAIVGRLEAIPHVRVIRWHTRVPVVDPCRVTADFAEAISSDVKSVWVAVHANHPRELSDIARAAIRRLRKAGVTLVSQSVLLKGVNDDADTLEALMRGFVELGIKPYYLHHADLAPGTSHFRTSIAEGQSLMRALHARLSGLAMPTYILDIPGGVSKAPLTPAYLRGEGESQEVRAADGTWTEYHG